MLDTNGFDDLKNNIIKKTIKKNKNDKSLIFMENFS